METIAQTTIVKLTLLGALLLLGACSSDGKLFDNNCTGHATFENPAYCTGTLHPNAGPWANGANKAG